MSGDIDLLAALQDSIDRHKAQQDGTLKDSDSCGTCGRFKTRPCASFDPPENCESEYAN